MVKEHLCHSKKIIAEFEFYCETKTNRMAEDFERTYKRPFEGRSAFASILAKIIHLDGVRIEIIGTWIYVFQSYEVREYLAGLGFWFSAKHKAWIFSGTRKRRFHTKLTTNQIRQHYGCEVVETEEQSKVTA